MEFSKIIWQTIDPVYEQIVDHPFNQELAKGTLEYRRFLFYLAQDADYLRGFSRVLALIAARSESSTEIEQFLELSKLTLLGERQLHAHFISSKDWDGIQPTLSCIGYVSYLLSTASLSSLEEALASVLPCFWIYKRLGLWMKPFATEANPYNLWIQTYSSEEFSTAVDQVIALLDHVAESASETTKLKMMKAFETSAYFEWHFWEDAYQMSLFKQMN